METYQHQAGLKVVSQWLLNEWNRQNTGTLLLEDDSWGGEGNELCWKGYEELNFGLEDDIWIGHELLDFPNVIRHIRHTGKRGVYELRVIEPCGQETVITLTMAQYKDVFVTPLSDSYQTKLLNDAGTYHPLPANGLSGSLDGVCEVGAPICSLRPKHPVVTYGEPDDQVPFQAPFGSKYCSWLTLLNLASAFGMDCSLTLRLLEDDAKTMADERMLHGVVWVSLVWYGMEWDCLFCFWLNLNDRELQLLLTQLIVGG